MTGCESRVRGSRDVGTSVFDMFHSLGSGYLGCINRAAVRTSRSELDRNKADQDGLAEREGQQKWV